MQGEEARGPRSTGVLVALLGAALLAFAGFVALGLWQVNRLAWKEALITRVERQLQAPPVAAPGPLAWQAWSGVDDEYHQVRVRGRYDHEHETLVRASTVLGAGYWVMTPLRSDQGFWVLVNRGFVPSQLRQRASRAAQEPAGEQEVSGLLRNSEPVGSLLQRNDPAQERWYSRDVRAIARHHALSGMPVAPYFIDAAAVDIPRCAVPGPALESMPHCPGSPGMVADGGAPSTAWPRPGMTVLRFSNNHLVYAITWFSLAAMVAFAAAYLAIDERRLRRLAGNPS